MRTRQILFSFVCGGLLSLLGGCSSQLPKASSLVQTEHLQPQPSAQTTNNPPDEGPASLETFSAFLDRA